MNFLYLLAGYLIASMIVGFLLGMVIDWLNRN